MIYTQIVFKTIIHAHWISAWWRHHMETFSALLALCTGNSPVTGDFPSQRPVVRSSNVFYDMRLIQRLSKQSWGWWFETQSHPLWRHCNESTRGGSLGSRRLIRQVWLCQLVQMVPSYSVSIVSANELVDIAFRFVIIPNGQEQVNLHDSYTNSKARETFTLYNTFCGFDILEQNILPDIEHLHWLLQGLFISK